MKARMRRAAWKVITIVLCAVLAVVVFALGPRVLHQAKGQTKSPPKSGKRAPAKGQTKTQAKKDTPTPIPGKPGQKGKTSQVPPVTLALSLDLAHDAAIPSRQPILVEASVRAKRGRGEDIATTLSKPGGSWGELVRIEVRGADGKPIDGVKVSPLANTGTSIVLDKENQGWLAWSLDLPGQVAPGSYTVVAKLKVAGFEAEAGSAPSILSIGGTADEDQRLRSALAKVRIQAYLGRADAAVQICDAYLAEHSGDPNMLEEKGDALAAAKRYKEALQAYNLALSKTPKQADGPLREPPVGLLLKRDRALEEAKKG